MKECNLLIIAVAILANIACADVPADKCPLQICSLSPTGQCQDRLRCAIIPHIHTLDCRRSASRSDECACTQTGWSGGVNTGVIGCRRHSSFVNATNEVSCSSTCMYAVMIVMMLCVRLDDTAISTAALRPSVHAHSRVQHLTELPFDFVGPVRCLSTILNEGHHYHYDDRDFQRSLSLTSLDFRRHNHMRMAFTRWLESCHWTISTTVL